MNSNLKIFYDGRCYVCHAEIELYRKQDVNKKLEFIDISKLDFYKDHYPVTEKDFNKYFHIQLDNGLYLHGVPAFFEIWKLVPAWNWMEKVCNNFIIRNILEVGYFFFVYIRPHLPKRRNCDSEACKI